MRTFQTPLSSAEEKEYLAKTKKGDLEARNTLVERNMRLVAHVAKKYHLQDGEQEELISVGTIGLIKAVNTFNLEKGSRFATYAAKCIDNEILMMFRAEKEHLKVVSLYEPIGTDKEGNEICLADIIEKEGQEIIDVVAVGEEIKQLRKLFSTVLNEKEQFVIRMRYGLSGCKEHTQKEIGRKLGISRSYVSRIEKAALKKLLAAMEKEK